MQDMKFDHDKRRNWYGATCQRCGVRSMLFFNKAGAVQWGDKHMSERHPQPQNSEARP